MNHDAETAAWRRQWQTESQAGGAPGADQLKERIEHQSRRTRLALIAPFLVTIGIGGYILTRAVVWRQATDILLAVEGWIFIAVVWIGSLWIARGTWRPLGQTTAAFVELAIRRCESNIKASRLGMWVYAIQLVAVCLLVSAMEDFPVRLIPLLTSWPVVLIGWFGFPAYVAWMTWFQRTKRAELARLFELKRQLTELDA